MTSRDCFSAYTARHLYDLNKDLKHAKSRTVEGGRRAGCASGGDEKESAGRGASRHAEQPRIHVEGGWPICGGPQASEKIYALTDSHFRC